MNSHTALQSLLTSWTQVPLNDYYKAMLFQIEFPRALSLLTNLCSLLLLTVKYVEVTVCSESWCMNVLMMVHLKLIFFSFSF